MADDSDDRVWYSANVPADFPSRNTIVNSCTRAICSWNGICIRISGKPRFWVKYGNASKLRGEGRTQAHVAGIVNANPEIGFRIPQVYLVFSRGGRGYIVMDYVQGTTLAERKQHKGSYDKSDLNAAAAAVQQLINIKMPPGTAPGPIGGGVIGHNFFLECYSALRYPSVEYLEAQINQVCFLLTFST